MRLIDCVAPDSWDERRLDLPRCNAAGASQEDLNDSMSRRSDGLVSQLQDYRRKQESLLKNSVTEKVPKNPLTKVQSTILYG
jgi:hypothetical protein